VANYRRSAVAFGRYKPFRDQSPYFRIRKARHRLGGDLPTQGRPFPINLDAFKPGALLGFFQVASAKRFPDFCFSDQRPERVRDAYTKLIDAAALVDVKLFPRHGFLALCSTSV